MFCVNCGEVSPDGFCSPQCRVMYTFRDKPTKCLVGDCKDTPAGLNPFCTAHMETQCKHCGRPTDKTFCKAGCAIRHPLQQQCICIHISENGCLIPCPGTPAAQPIRHGVGKPRKRGRPFHRVCNNCHHHKHYSWVGEELVKVERYQGGMAQKVIELMINGLAEKCKTVPIPKCAPESPEYLQWYKIAHEHTKFQISVNKARGCAILFFYITENDSLELLVIGEQTADQIKYGFIGGRRDFRQKINKTIRPEIPEITAQRELIEEGNGIRVRWIDLVYKNVHIGVYNHPTYPDSTEIVFSFIVNETAKESLVEMVERYGRTVYKGWWNLDQIYMHPNFREGDKNGLQEICTDILNRKLSED